MIKLIPAQDDPLASFDLRSQILPVGVESSINYHETFCDLPPTVSPTQMWKSQFPDILEVAGDISSF